MATWPVDETVPDGWRRSESALPLIWRIATGGPEDESIQIIGYTESADCGVSTAAKATRRRATARGA